ncbi:tagaturonate reductase [Rudanella lutea]|uniref:tagaturonate reductase n=1 Tax=Rudanella lutea TaxID=451374 RepID=UPI00035E9B4E|nr:tagaturonate reductase [Rudanella lutea]
MNDLSLKYLLDQPAATNAHPTLEQLLQLPETVLQFGTGALLRGLPDYLIDKANREGLFNGRIVVVKSTDGGDLTAFRRQDNLYTLCIRGVENGRTVEENVICSAISRVLSARTEWESVLQLAGNPDLKLVISNTTEVGIQLVQDDIRQAPPQSFPGKLLAVLYARYRAFGGDPNRGLVIVPTELIPDNGTRLEAILLELAHRNGLESDFIDWLESANTCCNSLVDRIVPGRPDPATLHDLADQLGYDDELLTIAEVYRLWAIEVPDGPHASRVTEVLSFSRADAGVFIRPNINQFRELKLRLLNGTHTLSCGLAWLAGFDTVREAMDDETMGAFIRSLMLAELLPGIPYPVDEKTAQRFATDVLDRFQNPYIEHRWLSITMQYTAKMQMRNVPTLLQYYHQLGTTPTYMALGFAAYLLFMRGTHQPTKPGELWYGDRDCTPYPIQDEKAGYFADLWARATPAQVVSTVLGNKSVWGHDLTLLPGFAERVQEALGQFLDQGLYATLKARFTKSVLLDK